VEPGARIEVTVSHDLAATGMLAPTHTSPETTAVLIFDRERRPTRQDLRPPRDLAQSVRVGGHLTTQIDRATGALSLSNPLWMQANVAGFAQYDQLTDLVFQLSGPAAFEQGYRSSYRAPDEVIRWSIRRMIPPGHYAWKARAEWRNLASDWVDGPVNGALTSFVVDAIPYDQEPGPPADPFDLQLVETATYPPLPAGLRASSWHPNGGRLRLQFVLKRQGDPWRGGEWLETDWLDRDPQQYDTLAVTEHVLFRLTSISGMGDPYDWRVRAVGEDGQASGWVLGRPFMVFIPAQRPTTLDDLMNTLERLDARVLDPRGPVEFPRLYLSEDWTGEGGTEDVSALRRWTERD